MSKNGGFKIRIGRTTNKKYVFAKKEVKTEPLALAIIRNALSSRATREIIVSSRSV